MQFSKHTIALVAFVAAMGAASAEEIRLGSLRRGLKAKNQALRSLQGDSVCSEACAEEFLSGCMGYHCSENMTNDEAWTICREEINGGVGPLITQVGCAVGCRDTAEMAIARTCGCEDQCRVPPVQAAVPISPQLDMVVEKETAAPAKDNVEKDAAPAKDNAAKDAAPAKDNMEKDAAPAKDNVEKAPASEAEKDNKEKNNNKDKNKNNKNGAAFEGAEAFLANFPDFTNVPNPSQKIGGADGSSTYRGFTTTAPGGVYTNNGPGVTYANGAATNKGVPGAARCETDDECPTNFCCTGNTGCLPTSSTAAGYLCKTK
jgi:hypothetical protein